MTNQTIASKMHIPSNGETLENVSFPHIRVLIVGAAKSGKTFSAMTFPNPIVLDFDNGLTAFKGRNDIIRIPFYSDAWCIEKAKCSVKNDTVDRYNGLCKWIKEEGFKLSKEQTLVLDSWTTYQSYSDIYLAKNPVIIKDSSGKLVEDSYKYWDKKQKQAEVIHTLLTSLECHVVVLAHELHERDKETGQLLDKIKPLMQGQFPNRMSNYYTDVFRMVAVSETTKESAELMRVSNGDLTKLQKDTKYYWQCKQSNAFNACTRMHTEQMYIEPTFESFRKYYAD